MSEPSDPTSGPAFDAVVDLFHRLVDLPPAERATELERVDAGLRREVETLLAADESPEPGLDSPALEAVTDLPLAAPEEELPEHIGDYRILAELGRGGMGVVYEARQEAPHRTVALKLIRAGLVTQERLRRFQQEAEVLGWLNHPGIAQVYAAGTAQTDAGTQPFIAMELVRGERIDLYVKLAQLSVPQRLALVAELCDAVQHAHQKGIVHRDLKPGNVLVTPEGRPKVLDFGVARITDPDLETVTRQTRAGEVLGTLPYMSPEQLAFDPSEVDTRSDVYALGVIAYELLAGQRPLDVGARSLPEAARMIAEDEPTTLGALDRRLRGDIEVIVSKALAKEKDRRYGSAEELARDIRRYLADEPIQARPPSRSYQLRKFARRNKGLVGGVAAAFVALLAGTVTSTMLYLDSDANLTRAQNAEGEWKAAAHTAEVQAALAGEVSGFLVDLFKVSDPSGEAGAGIRALELLDRGRRQMATRLEGQPEVRSGLMNAMARVYFNMGQYQTAAPMLEEAVATLRTAEEADPLELATALFSLGETRHYQGFLDQVLPLYQEALALREEALPPADPVLAYTVDVLSRLYRDLGGEENVARARELAERAHRMRIKGGAPYFDLSESLQSLGFLAYNEGDLDEAERLIGDALEIRERLEGQEAAFRAPELIYMLGRISQGKGDTKRAEELFRRCLEASRRTFGDDHIFVAHSLTALADTHNAKREFAKAEELLREALSLLGEDDHAVRSYTLASLAFMLHDKRDYDGAEEAYVAILEDHRSRFGEENSHTAVALNNLATLHVDQGRNDEAEALLRDALWIFAEHDPDHATHITARRNLAKALKNLGRHEEAVPFAKEAVLQASIRFGTSSVKHREAAMILAEVYESGGFVEKARGWRAWLAGEGPVPEGGTQR